MVVVTSACLLIGFMLVFMALFMRWIKDTQLGPVNIRQDGEEARRQEERNIRSQNRQAAVFWKLLPVGVGLLVVGVILFAVEAS